MLTISGKFLSISCPFIKGIYTSPDLEKINEIILNCAASRGVKKNLLISLGATKGCLLSNHGQLCIGKNLDEATHLSNALEKLSKQYFFCLLSKKLKLLSNDEMNEVLELFSDYKSIR